MAGMVDPPTFATVYDRYSPGVYATALRVLGRPAAAEDVTQDVFLRFWREPGRFDASRGDLGPYLRLMARSRALDLWRREQAAGRAHDRLKVVTRGDDAPAEEAPALAVERGERRSAVRAALRELPPREREALVLAYWGGLSGREVAEATQVPLGTAKSRIRQGLQRLAEADPLARQSA